MCRVDANLPVAQPPDHHLARAGCDAARACRAIRPPAPFMPLPSIPPALASLVLFPGPASGASRPVAQSPAHHLRSNPPLDETQMIEMGAMLTRAGLDATHWRPLEGAFYFLPPTYPDTVPVPAVEAVAPAVLPPTPALAGPAHGPRPVNRPQRDFAPGFLAAPAARLRLQPPAHAAAPTLGRRIRAGIPSPPPRSPHNSIVRCQSLGEMREQPSGRAHLRTPPRPNQAVGARRARADYSRPHSPLQSVQLMTCSRHERSFTVTASNGAVRPLWIEPNYV
jgi:hypothetical protein